ncbi:hypothetical protein ACQKWADRAFT_307051 [Trichoderma austrokoningii]
MHAFRGFTVPCYWVPGFSINPLQGSIGTRGDPGVFYLERFFSDCVDLLIGV